MKNVIKITLGIVIFAGLFVLVGFIESEHKKMTCKDMEVEIDYGRAEMLISEAQITNKIISSFDTLVGKKIADINPDTIEFEINKNGYIAEANVYTTLTGTLKINVKQRNPIIRVMPKYGPDYYIGEKGKLIPARTGFSSRVPVASGNISTRYSDTLSLALSTTNSELNDLYTLSSYIYNDVFLKAQIEQVYLNKDNEIELVPKVGRHVILFGDIDNMEGKFDKLKIFYEKGINKAGWDKYKSINLKYKDQVICEKK